MTPAAIHSPEKTEGQEEEAETSTGRKEGQKRRRRLEAERDSCSRGRGGAGGGGAWTAAVGAECEPPPARPWDAGAAVGRRGSPGEGCPPRNMSASQGKPLSAGPGEPSRRPGWPKGRVSQAIIGKLCGC